MNQKLYKNYADDIANYLKQDKKNNLGSNVRMQAVNESFSSKPQLRWLDRSKSEVDFKSLNWIY